LSLSTGSRLGVHEILGLIGAGGMGEVYRAHDTKLNRQVAIKVLPEAYAADPDRIARFHREAQAVAALNHPGIASIYDLAEADGTKFLVLELVEGETLADRLRRGPIPVEEALVIARQILEALEAAHEKGICHRDLKPANVKLTPDGAVKVLDFGLAKFLETSQSAPNLTQSPTLSVAASMPGMILGTAGYMSPEQAKGFQADHRSDIFSFGCILYELLTGRQTFDGETVSEVLAGVLRIEADLSKLPPKINPRLADLLRRCLEKNPKKRWHAAADVRVEIESLAGRALFVEEPSSAAATAPPLWRRVLSYGAAVLAGALVAGFAVWSLKPEPPRAVSRFIIRLPEGQQFTNTGRQVIALSPDGVNLVYVANNRLYLRTLSGLEPREIAGSLDRLAVINAVFSPDGQSLAYYAGSDQTLKRLALSGGTPVTICAASNVYGMSWDEDGLVFGQVGKGILRVSPNGGVPEVVAAPDGDQVMALPQLLPGGKAVLFSVKKAQENWDGGQVVVQVIGGQRKTLIEGSAHGRYLPTGHLAYAVSGMLMAVPFDVSSLTVTGGAVPIIEGVRRTGLSVTANPAAQFTYSSTGTLAFLPGPAAFQALSGDLDLGLFDRKGTAQPFKLKAASYRSPRVSPDGRYVAFDSDDEKESAVWIYEIAGGTLMRRLTFGGNNRSPVWSPDGRMVAFQSDREGDTAIFQQRADGSGTAERLTKPEASEAHSPLSWSPDGAHLLLTVQKDQSGALWTMSMKDRRLTPFGDVRSSDQLVEGVFSPDGRWIAYQVHEGSRNRQVFIQPFPATGAKYLVREGGHPYWTPKGDELILNIGPGQSIAVPVKTTPRVSFGQPTDFSRVGRTEGNPANTRRNSDWMPDGQHIVSVVGGVGAAVAGALVPEITVVLNWFEEIKQKAPLR
jgi:WD40 repeat protein